MGWVQEVIDLQEDGNNHLTIKLKKKALQGEHTPPLPPLPPQPACVVGMWLCARLDEISLRCRLPDVVVVPSAQTDARVIFPVAAAASNLRGMGAARLSPPPPGCRHPG